MQSIQTFILRVKNGWNVQLSIYKCSNIKKLIFVRIFIHNLCDHRVIFITFRGSACVDCQVCIYGAVSTTLTSTTPRWTSVVLWSLCLCPRSIAWPTPSVILPASWSSCSTQAAAAPPYSRRHAIMSQQCAFLARKHVVSGDPWLSIEVLCKAQIALRRLSPKLPREESRGHKSWKSATWFVLRTFMICVLDKCTTLSGTCLRLCRKVGVMEFGLNVIKPVN